MFFFSELPVLIILFSVLAIVLGEEHCIWNRTCYENDDGKKFNCPYDGPGNPIDDEISIQTMLHRCPDIYKNRKLK